MFSERLKSLSPQTLRNLPKTNGYVLFLERNSKVQTLFENTFSTNTLKRSTKFGKMLNTSTITCMIQNDLNYLSIQVIELLEFDLHRSTKPNVAILLGPQEVLGQ